MIALELTAIGASTGVILPEEMLARMKVGNGESPYVFEAPDGGYRLTPDNPGRTVQS